MYRAALEAVKVRIGPEADTQTNDLRVGEMLIRSRLFFAGARLSRYGGAGGRGRPRHSGMLGVKHRPICRHSC
jgi:hypothetical protein